MSTKIAFSIKKYNAETKKTSFYKDVADIFLQKILFKIDNFSIDLELENETNIAFGLSKFNKIYNKKSSSMSNQNFIITFSILNENFFSEINLNEFQNYLYSILDSYFNILSFITTKDNIGDITFYVICTATVKKIFLDHIIQKVIEQGKNPDDLIGVLSYNLILGGTISEKPEQKFIYLITNELNKYNYDLIPATDVEKQKYILDSYYRASNKIALLESEINVLIKSLENDYKDLIKDCINKNSLKYLEELIK